MRKEWILITFIILPCLILEGQNPFVERYTTADGLPSNTINCIRSDNDGFLWFATVGGLVRYDGSSFKSFGSREGLVQNQVLVVKPDSRSRVWLFCKGQQPNFFYHDKIYNKSNAPFLDTLRGTWNFMQDNQGNLYFYNYRARKIKVLDTNDHVKIYELPSEPFDPRQTGDGNNIQCLIRTKSGIFYIWTWTGLLKMANLADTPERIANVPYHNVFPVNDSIVYESIAFPERNYALVVKYVNGMPEDSIRSEEWSLNMILEDDEGNIWLSSPSTGVYCINREKVLYHLELKDMGWICKDNQGNIWANAKDGAYKISPSALLFNHIDNSNFNNEGIDRLDADVDRNVWGTYGSNIFLRENNRLYCMNEGIPLINDLIALDGQSLVIYNPNVGVDVIHGVSKVASNDSLRFDHIYNLHSGMSTERPETNKEKELVSFYDVHKKAVMIYSVKDNFRKMDSVPVDQGRYVFYDARDNLVVLEKDAEYIFQNGQKVPYNEFTGLRKEWQLLHKTLDTVADIFRTNYDSLLLVKDHRVFNLTSSFDYSFNTPFQRIAYQFPFLFLSTFRNIYICDNPLEIAGNESVKLRLIDINFSDIRDILACNDSLYIGSADGLTIISIDRINEIKTAVPVPYLSGVEANDNVADLYTGPLTIKGKNKISFEFGSIDYSWNPVLFSYMLEGFDKEWNTGSIKGIAYANLPVGKYRFLLKAGKSNSPWSDPVVYDIVIKATFWQLPLFYVLLSLLVAGLTSLTVLAIKNRQLKKREMEHQQVTLEQKALQSMMNPHFLFNTLGSIQNFLLQNKSGEAGLYLSQFARLIRQNMQSIHSAMISLDAEIERLKNYLELERFRMDNRFDYKFIIDENLDEDVIMIPSMITQPFVENSILHGISPLETGGLITVSFSLVTEKTIKVIVDDNGVGMAQSKAFAQEKRTHLHMSLEMTRKRIEILGKKYRVKTSLEVSEAFPGRLNPGTRVVVVLPVSYEKEG